MIPHHSIAILTSERADIDDLRVRDLADRGHPCAAQRDRRDGLAHRRHREDRAGHHAGRGWPETASWVQRPAL